MQTHCKLFVAFCGSLLLASPAAAIGCFSDGVDIDGLDVNGLIDEACNRLAGNYEAKSQRSQCRNVGNGNHIDLVVKNTFNHDQYISWDHCTSNMKTTRNGCRYGGIRATGLAEMTFDPNGGNC
jgi:hypothetical protein